MKGRLLNLLRNIALLAVLAVFVPVGRVSAADKMIAVVFTCDLPRYREAHRAFVKALGGKGYEPGDVEIVLQTPNPDPISWANSVRKFNAIGADLIVTYGAPATAVAVREEQEIPIVFADVYGPVETGIAKSMQSAGRNLAGVSSKIPLITLVKTAAELKPVRSLGVIYSSREEGSLLQMKELTRIASQMGISVHLVNLAGGGVDQGLATLFAAKVDYIYVSECTAASRSFDRIVHRAGEQKIPVLTLMPGGAARGALISIEVDPVEQGQDAAELAAKILSGKKAGQLPVATPKKVELIVNLKAAKALELPVPFPALAAATRVLK